MAMKYYKASTYVHDVGELSVGNTYAIAGIVGQFMGLKNDTMYYFVNVDGIEFWIEEYLLQDYMDNKLVNNIIGVVKRRKKY